MNRRILDRRRAADALKKKLGRLLTAEVGRQGISVAELARRAVLLEQTVRNLANGQTVPRLDLILALERGLDVEPGWACRHLKEDKET